MKTLLTILLGLSLSACSADDPLNRAKQDYACRDDGGVYSYMGTAFKVTCRNGTLKEWTDLIITEEYYPVKTGITIGTKLGE